MTPKEMREYEEGKTYGYSHPNKVHGWSKSAAWNNGLRAGQAVYRAEQKKEQRKWAAYWKRRRETER